MAFCPNCDCDSYHLASSSDRPYSYCHHCGFQEEMEDLKVTNPYEEEKFIASCPTCGDDTVWIRMVEEDEAQCQECGLFEDQSDELIKEQYWNTKIKIFRADRKENLLPLVEFSARCESEEDAFERATRWVLENIDVDCRKDIHVDIEYSVIGETIE